MPRSYLFFCQFIQNSGAAGAFIADNGPSGTSGQLIYKFLWKSRISKGYKGLGGMNSHHLPVACHGILTLAFLTKDAVITQGLICRRHLP